MTRAAADKLLRTLALSTLVGAVLVVVAAIVVADHRGLLLAIGAIYLLTSVGAYVGLRRSLDRAFAQRRGQDQSPSSR